MFKLRRPIESSYHPGTGSRPVFRDGDATALAPLPEFGNRRALDEALAAAADAGEACLLLFDVDGLSGVERGGRIVREDALACVAREMARVFAERAGVLCRVGAFGFAALLRDEDAEASGRIAKALVRAVAAQAAWLTAVARERPHPPTTSPRAPRFGLSAGVTGLRRGETAAEWFARADAALRAAQGRRGGRVLVV